MEAPEDSYLNDEDAQLMLRVRAGDSSAMEALIERHKDAVYATVSTMLRDSGGDVDDIAQQVFIRVWKGADSYEPTAKFTTWMYTILKNLVSNELRRLRRKPFHSADAIEEDSGFTLAQDGAPTPDATLLQSELTDAVDRAIDTLPENMKLAIQLRRFDNLPYEEIAKVLGNSVSSTKSLLFRARNLLKDKLKDFL